MCVCMYCIQCTIFVYVMHVRIDMAACVYTYKYICISTYVHMTTRSNASTTRSNASTPILVMNHKQDI